MGSVVCFLYYDYDFLFWGGLTSGLMLIGLRPARDTFNFFPMVFHCQPWLTMVDSVLTMMVDHGHFEVLTMVH